MTSDDLHLAVNYLKAYHDALFGSRRALEDGFVRRVSDFLRQQPGASILESDSVHRRVGLKACPKCKIRAGLGRCPECALKLVKEDGIDDLEAWARIMQAWLNQGRLHRQFLEPERQHLRDWLNGFDGFDFQRHYRENTRLRR